MTTIETYYHGRKLNSLPQWVILELNDKLRLGQLVTEHYQRSRALEAQLAALTAERDKLRAAVKDMLHIFDRGLAEGTIGQIVCERAWQTLEVTK